jgi:hypothetical protein
MVSILRLVPTTAISLVLLTACAGQNTSGTSALTPSLGNSLNERASTKQTGGPTVYAESRNAAGLPFIAVFGNGGKTFLRKIKNGSWVAADSVGYLYNAYSPVTVYSDAGKTLVQKFPVKNGPREIGYGDEITADGLGNFYVGCMHKQLCQYQIGKQGPLREFNIAGGESVATDTSGNLYLGLGYVSVQVYALGSSTPERTITSGIAGPEAVAVDPQGDLYVANTNAGSNHIPNIVVYTPNSNSPVRTITAGVVDPVGLHTDSSGDLGVLNGSNITIYTPGSSSPSKVITQGIDSPVSFAFDASNNLYVANIGASINDPGSITVYSSGSYTLTRTITKNIKGSVSVAVGP